MKLTPEERAQYLREVQYDLPNLMRRIQVLRAEEFVNNVEKLRLQHRRRIQIRTRMSVEYAGEDKLKYTCRTCGYEVIQRPGGKKYEKLHDPKHPLSFELVKKLAAYQDQGGGCSGPCPRCTKRIRDERYPKGWSPWNKVGGSH